MKKNTEMIDIIKSAIAVEYQLPGMSSMVEINNDQKWKGHKMVVKVRSSKDLHFLICRFDTPNDLFPYFNDIEGYKKNCDYIIFAENTSKLYVFLVELKNSIASPEKQLKISKPFAEFLVARIEAVEGSFGKEIIYKMVGIKERARVDIPTPQGFADEYKFKDDYLLLPRNNYMDLDLIITANDL